MFARSFLPESGPDRQAKWPPATTSESDRFPDDTLLSRGEMSVAMPQNLEAFKSPQSRTGCVSSGWVLLQPLLNVSDSAGVMPSRRCTDCPPRPIDAEVTSVDTGSVAPLESTKAL